MPIERAQAHLVLPLSSGAQDPSAPRIGPRCRSRITARPTKGAFSVEKIYLSGAGTPGGAADWVVNDLEVDGRSQLGHKDLPGVLFGTRGIAAGQGQTELSFSGLDPVERDRELALVVTYVGSNPDGAPFFGAAVGSRPAQRLTVVPIVPVALIPREMKTTISARVQSAPFKVHRLEITGDDAHEWIIQDLRINGQSQLRQPGPLPGDLFASPAIDTFLAMGTCDAGSAIEIDATYVGSYPSSRFVARLQGTVVRADDTSPPPDLTVLVEIAGQGPGDVVIAACDWRPPAQDDSAP